MTSTTTRIITTTLLALAVAAPVASGRPLRDREGVRTSSLASTTSPYQDLRNADNRAPRTVPLGSRSAPAPADPAPAASGGGISPLALILPAGALLAMLAAGVAYRHTPRRSPA